MSPIVNLVLVNDPRYQSLHDLELIRSEISKLDSSIVVHIGHNTLDNARLNRRILDHPTLIVSFTQLKRFAPSRGHVCQGRWISKADQIAALDRQGVRVPSTALLTPQFKADAAEWGEVVLVKPASPGSTFGKHVNLVRTSRLRFRPPESYPDGHPGRHGPMLVQQFIDTGTLPASYRVLTLLGEPLYCRRLFRKEGEVRTDVGDEELENMPVSIAAGPPIFSHAVDDFDILAAAVAASLAFPDVPLQGIDLVRDKRSGRVFVLELNPGGNTWHFSSVLGRRAQAGIGEKLGLSGADAEAEGRAQLVGQFGAFQLAAKVLAEAARTRAA